MASSAGMVWFRRDLRLDDNPAWAAATAEHRLVTAVFVVDPLLMDRASPRRTARLLGDVAALDDSLTRHGGRLLIRVGDPRSVIPTEAKRLGVAAVHLNHDVTPYASDRDDAVKAALAESDIEWVPEWGTLVHEPGRICTNKGTLSQVFTPFFRVWERTSWSPWPVRGDAGITDDPGETRCPWRASPIQFSMGNTATQPHPARAVPSPGSTWPSRALTPTTRIATPRRSSEPRNSRSTFASEQSHRDGLRWSSVSRRLDAKRLFDNWRGATGTRTCSRPPHPSSRSR